MSDLNYETELCSAPSGRHYVEIYDIAGGGRRLAHTTARRDTPGEARALACDWIAFVARAAATGRTGEAVPEVA